MGSGHIEGAEEGVDKGKEQAEDTPLQVGVGGLEHGVGADDAFEDAGGEPACEDKHEAGQHGEQGQTVVEGMANGSVISLSVAAGHENLCADAESQSYHEHGDVEDAAQCRGSQFDGSDTPQKGCVGHADELFHERADQYGPGNHCYLFVAIGVHGVG